MGMSKKYYILIASVIDEATCPDNNKLIFKEQLIEGLCRILKSENNLFNPAKFTDACRLTEIINDESSSS